MNRSLDQAIQKGPVFLGLKLPYSKLDSKITKSSLWDEADHVVRVWVAFLAEKDENGFVRGTMKTMQRICNVTSDENGEKFENAIKILESPDQNSNNKEYEGRRIERVDGGWIVLNHEDYRLKEDTIREQNRERVRKFREKHKNGNSVTLRNVTPALHTVSVSVSDSLSVSDNKNTSTDTVDTDKEQFDLFRKNYPGTKRGLETEYANFKKKHKDYKKVIQLLSQSLSDQKSWMVEMRDAEMFVPEWKMLQTWINQRCWEMEKPEIINKNKSGTDILREREARGEKI